MLDINFVSRINSFPCPKNKGSIILHVLASSQGSTYSAHDFFFSFEPTPMGAKVNQSTYARERESQGMRLI